MIIKAVIPIKIQSKRLPKKNLLKINDKPLVEWAISALDGVKGCEETIVYCSYSYLIDKYITSPHKTIKRCTCLDTPDSNFHSIMKYLTEVDEQHADVWIWHHATSPFITTETIQDMLDKVMDPKTPYDSAFAVYKLPKFAWYMGHPLNFTPSDIGFTQTVEPIYIETSGPWIFSEKHFKETGKRVTKQPYMKVVSFEEGIDIDTRVEFELARKIKEAE